MFASNTLELVLDAALSAGVHVQSESIESVMIQLAALPSSPSNNNFSNFTMGDSLVELCETGNIVRATLHTDTHHLFVRAMVQVGPSGSSSLQAVLPSGVIFLSSGVQVPATTITVPLELDGSRNYSILCFLCKFCLLLQNRFRVPAVCWTRTRAP